MNGTPLRRVDQAYVIATKTKVDISTVKIPKELNDNYFKRTKAEKKSSGEIFSDSKKVRNGISWSMLNISSMYVCKDFIFNSIWLNCMPCAVFSLKFLSTQH